MNKNDEKVRVSKGTLKTAKRLLRYVTSRYKVQFFAVFICIIISSVASISVSLSLKFLLDDFIIPLIGQKSSEFYRALSGTWSIGVYFSLRCDFILHLYKIDGNDRSGCLKAGSG